MIGVLKQNKDIQLSLDFSEVIPTNEYMTTNTRIPVFVPTQNRKKMEAGPEEGAVIETAWC